MAEKMTLDRMAQNANAARRVGDERTAEYWTEQVELANLREQRESNFVTIVADSQLLDLVDSRERPTPGLMAMVERHRSRTSNEWDALKGSPEHG